MFRRNFLFGCDLVTANVIDVHADELYQPGKGYGFVIEKNRREQELLLIPELNSAFETMYWYQDRELTRMEEDNNGCYFDSDFIMQELEKEAGEKYEGEHRRIPLSFKLDVPRQGNYKVILGIMSDEDMEEVLIFLGRRRLAYKGNIPKNQFFECTMMTNICDIIPRGKERIFTDKSLDITVIANKPRITSLSIIEVKCPTIYIAGDSTVTDQSADYPYAPGTSYSGWGQMLPLYFKEGIAVSNHAHSGLTTESFRKEGHYATMDQYCKPRDYFLYQFGHNDQKLEKLKARGGYRMNLIRYIMECRDRGAYPLLVTPVARNTWKGNDGTYNDLLKEYAESCTEIGKLTDTPVIDLHKKSMEFIKEHGLEKVKAYFFPKDYTHSNDYGAYKMASFVATEIINICKNHRDIGYQILAEEIKQGWDEWEPKESIQLPIKPKIYGKIENPVLTEKILSDIDNLDEEADRASVLDMIIKTAKFFPTNVYNDMYEDVLGHEWYAGTIECAYQNGIINPELEENKKINPKKKVTLEEFVIFAISGYKSRKKLPDEKQSFYDEKVSPYALKYVRAASELGIISKDGSDNLKRVITRKEAVDMCRKLNI